MSATKHTTRADEQMAMVCDCENRESRLSEWETGFIDSIRNQLDNGRTLSNRQSDTLDEIWERVTQRL